MYYSPKQKGLELNECNYIIYLYPILQLQTRKVLTCLLKS